MRRLFVGCCLVTLLAGCGDKAKDLYETAQLARLEGQVFRLDHWFLPRQFDLAIAVAGNSFDNHLVPRSFAAALREQLFQ